jgi:PAS domain S-box-containing protein
MRGNVTEQFDVHAVAFLRLATTFLIFGSVAFAIVLLIGAPEQRLRLIGPTVIALVAATAKYCHSRGRNRAAIQVLVFGIWGEVAGTSLIAGGLHAPAVFLYLPIIILAGWLLGTRIAYAVALLSVAVTLGLALAESRHALPLPHSPPGLMLIIQVGVFLFSAIMIGRIVRSYQTRLREVEALGSELDERVKALAASEASYRGLFDSVNEAIYIQDPQGHFLDVNDGAVRMYGHPRERFIGQTPEFVSAPGMNDLAAVGAMVGRAFAGTPQRFEFWGLRANGEAFPKDVRLVKGMWFGQDVVIATAEDITERKRAEAELRRSEEMFSKVFHASPIAIVLTNLSDGRFLDVNDAFFRLFGWTREEAVGRTSVELGNWINCEDRQAWADELKRRSRVSDYEIRLRNKRGNILMTNLSAEIISLRGEPCALVLVIDETARKQAEIALRDSRESLAEAQRIGHVGNWTLDIVNKRMTWSDEIYRIYERPPDSFGGAFSDLLALVPPEEVPGMVEAYRNVTSTDRLHEHKHRILTPDGRIKSIHARWEVLCDADGKPVRALGTAQDITEQEEASAEIRRLNAGLEQRVQERTAELTAANRELESFAYSISHDLRAPLRGIDGFSHLLAEEYGDKLDDQGRGYLDRVRRAAQRMGSLIDDILELSRVTRQEMRRVDVDLGQIATELFEDHSRVRPEPRVEISLATDCKVHGDPQLLRVMMQNLMENALKYSGKKASPKIEFGHEWRDGERVYFLRDNGVGFDMKYAGRLFAPFQRLHKPEEFEGTGIGLATVARIVHRHGGRVWAESTPDVHTTIRFTLP